MIFHKLRKYEIKNNLKSVTVQIFFVLKFGSKRDSPLQINRENFIMCCTVGFKAIPDQRPALATLDENWIAHAPLI